MDKIFTLNDIKNLDQCLYDDIDTYMDDHPLREDILNIISTRFVQFFKGEELDILDFNKVVNKEK